MSFGGFGAGTGGFGKPAGAGGFGQQPQAGAGGFGQQPQAGAGGFGQQQQAGAGGFGQQQQAGAGGFGQQQQAGAGGFGQQAGAGGFGQQQQAGAGGFGQQANAGGFGQQPQQGGGFGQQPQAGAGGFGQPAGGFGQQAGAGGFGQQPQQGGGFGQQPQAGAGGFGQQAQAGAGGFGQPAGAGGFGQQQQQAGTTGGFGQPAGAGGFGQQPQAGAGGFGQQPQQGGGFGQQAGGFGQHPQGSAGGFGQQPQQGGGFGQQAQAGTGGFGQPAGGFGQPAGGAGGFGQQQQQGGGFGQKPAGATGFGQPAGGTGFGQPAGATGFGQQQQQGGGFGQQAGATGFGQKPAGTGFGQQAGATGGFGQQAGGTGFGQPAGGTGFGQQAGATGFGQKPAGATGFGQQAGATGGFGQQAGATGGFGQPAGGTGFGQQQQGGGFGQQAGATGFGQKPAGATGFGQQAGATGGFGQQAGATGGFGQQAGGFGQQAGATGFGQKPAGATGGFGQQAGATGGFGQQAGATGGFGQQAGATGGFGQQAGATGGFGQQAGATGGFGQQAGATGGFGQQAGATGGFGQQAGATGGFGQQAGATGGFGQQAGATGGFGQQAGATGGFGQQAGATGGFGQQAGATGGFGQQAGATGGFGQQAGATGGFGQQAGATGGFGQQAGATGGFGQQAGATGGFGQQAGATGGFGQQAGGGGFGQKPATAGFGMGNAGSAGGFGQQTAAIGSTAQGALMSAQTASSFVEMPDFTDTPYGNVLLFLPTETTKKEYPRAREPPGAMLGNVPLAFTYQLNLNLANNRPLVLNSDSAIKQNAAGLSLNSLSSAALRDLIAAPSFQLGSTVEEIEDDTAPQTNAEQTDQSLASIEYESVASGSMLHVPRCTNPRLVLNPSLTALQRMSSQQLQRVSEFRISTENGKVEVSFLQPVNLVACDIADAVDIQSNGHVDLYPNTVQPPALGTGLNVRCRVSVNDETGLQQQNADAVEEVVSTLRRRCFRDGVSFEGYDTASGSWSYIINGTDVETVTGKNPAVMDAAASEPDSSSERDSESFADGEEGSRTPMEQPVDPSHHEWVTPQQWRGGQVKSGNRTEPLQESAWQSEYAAPLPSRYAPRNSAVHVPAGNATLPDRHSKVYVPVPSASGGKNQERSLAMGRPTADSAILSHGVRKQDFTLPYQLLARQTPKNDHAIPSRVPLVETELRKPAGQVLVVSKASSPAFEISSKGLKSNSLCVLGRGFRVGWGTGGRLAMPTFSQLEDSATGGRVVPEVAGACVRTTRPFESVTSTGCNDTLRRCSVELLRALLGFGKAESDESSRTPLATVNLSLHNLSTGTLSEEKISRVIQVVEQQTRTAAQQASLSPTGKATCAQWLTLLRLVKALYSITEDDDPFQNAVEEHVYLDRLRRKNLSSWLTDELSSTASNEENVRRNANPHESVLASLLSNKLRNAQELLRSNGDEELAQVARLCGNGNQFGSYVHMLDDEIQGMKNSDNARERIIRLLAGEVEPFITQPRYPRSSKNPNAVSVDSTAATWKQLLGIFAFYGCTPDTTAEDVISAFTSRLRAPTSRKEGSLPPYAEGMKNDFVNSKRGLDILSRGNAFEDSALLVLEAFSHHTSPPPAALHPHSSTYFGTDYVAPFILLVVFRSLGVATSAAYQAAELRVLNGLAAQLDSSDSTWIWALLPLYMIDDARYRTRATTDFLSRNAVRFQQRSWSSAITDDFHRLVKLLSIPVDLLEPIQFEEEKSRSEPLNAPSLATRAHLLDVLGKFRVSFRKAASASSS